MGGKVVRKSKAAKKADEDSGLSSQLEAERMSPDPEITDTGGTTTTDPAFAGGAMEVDTKPWNPPKDKK